MYRVFKFFLIKHKIDFGFENLFIDNSSMTNASCNSTDVHPFVKIVKT